MPSAIFNSQTKLTTLNILDDDFVLSSHPIINNNFQIINSYAGQISAGMVRLATNLDITNNDLSSVITPNLLNGVASSILSSMNNGLISANNYTDNLVHSLSSTISADYALSADVNTINNNINNNLVTISGNLSSLSSYTLNTISSLSSTTQNLVSTNLTSANNYTDGKISSLSSTTSGNIASLSAYTVSSVNYLSGAIDGKVITYTNLSAVPVTIGGIAAGTTFNNVPISTMFDMLLYPYQTPTFSSFGATGISTPMEVGSTIGPSYQFTWATTNSANVSANTVRIIDVTGGSVNMATNLANDGAETVSYSTIAKNTVASHTLRISATNTQSTTFTRDLTYSWMFKVYSGNSLSTSLTESDIEALSTSSLKSTYTGNYTFSAVTGTYKYICYPSSYGTAASFKDQSTGLDVAMNDLGVVSVTNVNGVTTDYQIYRSTNPFAGAITIVVA